MTEVVANRPGPAPDSFRAAKRSEAMPKASLFGSLLEMQNEETARSVREMDLSSVKIPRTPGGKGAGQKFTLPDDVKRQLPGAAVLERSRQDFQSHRVRLHQQESDLKRREEEALYDRSKVIAPKTSGDTATGNTKPTWFSEADLAGSKEINTVGLNVNQSFNRDKYGQRAPVHNYSLIGDVLRPGMDFPRRERTEVQMRNQGYGKGDLRNLLMSPGSPRRASASGTPKVPKQAAVDLPPNIKHQFGSKVCNELLSDEKVVESTIKEQKDIKENLQRRSQPFMVPKFSRESNPDYEMLGNALRMNTTPGYTTNNKISTTKTDYSDQVHLFRYQDPDKWRYQKDELSKWREVRFMQRLLAKGWDSVLDNAPKFKRDWESQPRERTKTAPAPQKQKPPGTRRKPRTAAPSKKADDKENALEDFVFQTPPRTPSPEKVKLTENKRDNEFWDFYDKK